MFNLDRGQAQPTGLSFSMDTVSSSTRSGDVCSNHTAPQDSIHDEEPLRSPPWRSDGLVFVKQEEWSRAKPIWRRRPLDFGPAEAIEEDELMARLNTYFEDSFDNDIPPILSDVAAVAGYESITQMINDARRKGPLRMRTVGRALLALQAHYEELAQGGSRIAMMILERIPSFDSREAPEQIATRAFQPAPQEHVVHVSGMKRLEDEGRELSPMDAYNQIIQRPTFQEIADVIDLREIDGAFSLPLEAVPAEPTDESLVEKASVETSLVEKASVETSDYWQPWSQLPAPSSQLPASDSNTPQQEQ